MKIIKKKMSYPAAKRFVLNLDRYELHADYACFSKGVRVSLINLGYDESWVNDDFREIMDHIYLD